MPVCSKDARRDDKLTKEEEAGYRQIEDQYNVNARPDKRGGVSHTEDRHCRSTAPQHLEATKTYLRDRISTGRVPAATNFNDRESLVFARHKYLATFASEMAIRASKNPRIPHEWVRDLDIEETVGFGFARNGEEAKAISWVRFVFVWDPQTRRWFEKTGYPLHPYVQRTEQLL